MPSPVARQAILLSGTAVKPVWQANFLTASSLPAGLTYTKSGSIPATLFDSTGKLTYQGNNLLAYSNTFSTGWSYSSVTVSNPNAVSDPFGGTNATTITATANAAQLYQYLAISSAASTNYVTSIWVKRRSGSGNIRIFNPNSTTTVIPVTSTWTKFSSSGAGGAGFIYPGILIATNGDAVDVYAATASAVTYETTPRSQDQIITTSAALLAPRLDTNLSTLSPAGLLVEEQRVNIALYSRTYTNAAWTNANNHLTLASGQGTSIDGTNSLWKVTQTGNGDDNLYQAVTTGAGSYTTSYIVKAGNTSWMWLDVNQTTDHIVWYNLTGNGSIGTQSGATGTIQYLGNSLYRITHTFTAVMNNAYLGAPMPCTADNVLTRVNGNYSLFDYAQLEAGAFATSITAPTQSSTVTRTADVVTPTTYASKASIWQRLSESAGTTARTYYAPGALPSPFPTGYWYQSMAAYPRALTTAEQTPRLVVGAPY